MARRALGPATLRLVQALDALAAGAWVVACSGGADSLALTWAAAFVARRRDTRCRAVIIDHGLQPGSGAVAERVCRALASLPVPHADPLTVPARVVAVAVDASKGGPEAAARTARYAALEAEVDEGERVLLGHTLDDQAETVLLGLARGSGARSLAGMPAARGVFVRPLLSIPRETTAQACGELGLAPWRDPMNDDPIFARVRVRERVLPVLERELGPGVRDALARTATLLRADADLLDARAGASPRPSSLHCGWLAGLDPAMRTRVIHAWLAERASGITANHVAAVDALVTDWRGQKGIDVPGHRVIRTEGELTLRARP